MKLTWQQELSILNSEENGNLSALDSRSTHAALVRKGLAVGGFPSTLTAAGLEERNRLRVKRRLGVDKWQ